MSPSQREGNNGPMTMSDPNPYDSPSDDQASESSTSEVPRFKKASRIVEYVIVIFLIVVMLGLFFLFMF
ncbi:MAG: hypothetical protein AB8B91_04005 [Rubripirellula sp.]